MKPVLLQTLIAARKKNTTRPDFKDIDPVHGGHKDRSGFIVFFILVVSVIVALAMS